MARRDRRRLRPEPITGTPPDDGEDGEDDDDQDDSPEQLPDSSLPDLTTQADPQAFDQVFSDADADLRLQGRFDPVAGPKQVIPRVAYTINFQMVYNESRGRWEPQKKSDLEAEDGDITKVGSSGTLVGLLIGIDQLDSTVLTDAVDETETATDTNLSSNVTVT
jgi:hypothetical protein